MSVENQNLHSKVREALPRAYQVYVTKTRERKVDENGTETLIPKIDVTVVLDRRGGQVVHSGFLDTFDEALSRVLDHRDGSDISCDRKTGKKRQKGSENDKTAV